MHRGGFITVFFILAAFSLLLDWYVFNGLRTFAADWSSQRLRQLFLGGYLLVSVGITVLFVLGFGSFSTAKGMTPFHEWMLSLFLTIFVTKIFFVIVLSLGDFGRFLYGLFKNGVNKKDFKAKG